MSALLEVDDVSVSFDGYKAINHLSFSINQGDLRAIIGPNGAGKTTFMDIVTGKTRPDSGKVEWGWPTRDLLKCQRARSRGWASDENFNAQRFLKIKLYRII